MAFATWIDRLAKAELILAAFGLPLALAHFSAGIALVCAVAILVLFSGALFALEGRARALDTKRKAGGGLVVRDGKPRMVAHPGHHPDCPCRPCRRLRKKEGLKLGEGVPLFGGTLRKASA